MSNTAYTPDDETLIASELDSATADGRLISDAGARVIAAQFAVGGDAFACLASTGTILLEEIRSEIPSLLEGYDSDSLFIRALTALDHYVSHHGVRGTVPGWSDLWLRGDAR
ncbi:hypothetical protein FXF51_01920 [Nonomuraea sp. PA05]|uniref:hypothetical protein n=1 Tax=Nonomuraea sp. PA05 TaxID=2604466 RepID=UPI0011D51E69|nr:hypothetical protein [Nonomuraea sp. PA05]TYB71218.1 hypothetical protein FXF51_01920 [Nonomuraea sp. PA05]